MSNQVEGMEHVVLVLFENRSLDNLFGRLYEPGEGKSFDGVVGKDLSNPIPEWAEHKPEGNNASHTKSPRIWIRRVPIPARSIPIRTRSYSMFRTMLIGIRWLTRSRRRGTSHRPALRRIWKGSSLTT